MDTRSEDAFENTGDAAALRALLDAVAAEDGKLARELLRENPALADAALHDDDLAALLRAAIIEDGAVAVPSPAIANTTDDPGLFTELTRELAPERAEALFRKIVPLVVYELLRTLDKSSNVATVQQIVDHLCSPPVQKRLRACEHVRDGILDELSTVLQDAGVRDALDRDAVHAIMVDCGVTSELMTLVNCIRLLQAQAG